AAASPATLSRAITDPGAGASPGWSAAARMTLEAFDAAGCELRLIVTCADGSTITATFARDTGELQITGSGSTIPAGAVHRGRGKTRRTMPGGASLKLLVRRRWV